MPRIAVLSVAHIHARGFCERLVAAYGGPALIWDDDPERGRQYAEEFGVRFEPDLEAAVGDAGAEGFLITAENTRHLPLVRAALATGKPVLCEKPLAVDPAEAREMAALSEEHGAPLTSGYVMPFAAAAGGVRELLAAGGLGELTHVSHRNAHSAAYGRWFDDPQLAWFADPESAGGGALMDLGTHSVHFVRHLFGPVRRVWATVANVTGAYPAVDDYGCVMLEFADGVRGRVEAGWCQQGGRRGLEAFGSERALWQDGGYVTGAGRGDPEPVPEGPSQPNRVDRLAALITGELSESAWREDLACCVDAVAIMAAAYRSAASGTWEDVSD